MTNPLSIFDVSTAQESILRRRAWDSVDVPPALLNGIESIFGARLTPDEAVRRILADVRARGDAALIEWTERIDRVALDATAVSTEQLDAARSHVESSVLDAMAVAAARIERFHKRQPSLTWSHKDDEGTLGQMVRPIERVGIYIPGGKAPLPSSLLMTAIPARVAGVRHLSIISPPQQEGPFRGLPHPAILAAAALVGVDAVYVGGGAQAIGALAFGTESIVAVDKICGPGNLFTTLAKRQVYGAVGIDGLPGPTETMVIADEHADPTLAAADMLAQVEHGLLSSAILLTPSRTLAERVQIAALSQLEELAEGERLAEWLAAGSGIVVTANLGEAFVLANAYAAEHLCLLLDDPWPWVERVQNAGGVFVGERSFEVLGDYVAGPSHVMPTGGTARFASPVNVNDFVKIISVVGLNERALRAIGPAAQTLAEAEGLFAHAAAVKKRMQEE